MNGISRICTFVADRARFCARKPLLSRRSVAALLLTTGIGVSHAIAPCNLPSAWVNDSTYNALTANRTNAGALCLTAFNNPVSNLVDSTLGNSTAFSLTGLGCSVTYAVRDPDVADTHPAGYYAGFKLSPANLLAAGVAATVRIETYRAGALIEGQDVVSGLIGIESSLLDGAGLATVGFVTTQPFDEIRLRYTTLTGALFSGTVYHAVIERYCAGAALACNTETPIHEVSYPVSVPANLTGLSGLACVGCSISNANHLISSSNTDYAEINLLAGAGSVASVAVRDQLTVYPAGTLAGFNLERPTLLDVDLLSGLALKTYLNGTLQETSSTGSLLAVGSGLLTGSTAQQVSFVTSQPFDTVQLQVGGLAGVASTTRVYHAVFEQFCTGPALSCNTQTPILPTDYPVIVNGTHTGLGVGVCVGCGVLNAANLLSTDATDYATIRLTAGVLTSGAIAVKDVLSDYPAGTFAGFVIENPNLLGVDLLSGLLIRTYKDNILQETINAGSGALLSVDAALLTGSSGKRQVGFISSLPFDEVQLEVVNLLGILSETRVYYALFQSFCAGSSPTCGNHTVLTQPSYPVLIDQAHSGITGLACALCAVNQPQRVIDNDPNNYGEIELTVGVLAAGSIAVRDAVTDYPAGTFAGFDVFNAAIVGVGLLNAASITTYRNGVQQESRGGSLLSLQLLTASRQIMGFTTSQPFDEMRITIANLVNLNLGTTRVYGALVRPAEVGSEINGGGGVGACPALRDYADAPAGFGDVSHTVSNGIYLGTTAPDTESYALNSNNGFADYSGDDSTGSPDEGGWLLPTLAASNSSYSVPVVCAGIGTVAGWIDFDHSGNFDPTERSSALCSGGTALLNWSNISPQAGATAARFRIALAADDVALPIGVASSGEVEDLLLNVQQLTVISGRVFTDNSGQTGLAAHAYNGLQDDPSELGIADSTVELTDCLTTVLATTQTDANGDYTLQLEASGLSSPNFCIVQHNLTGYTSVSGSAGYQRIADQIIVANTAATSYPNQLFGDAQVSLVLVADGQKTITASGIADYSHTLKSEAVITPNSLTITMVESPVDMGWSQLVYHDSNCNRLVDAGELVADSLPQLTPISQICLIQRIQAPAAASSGMQHMASLSTTYRATIQGNEILTGNSSSVTDTTLIGTASLQLHKQVRRVNSCSGTVVGLEPFSDQNNARNGDFLEYEITYTNAGTRNLSQLKVRDAITDAIQFEHMSCVNTPTDANCTIDVQPALGAHGAISWLISGSLKPAAQGSVRFCVLVTPLFELALH